MIIQFDEVALRLRKSNCMPVLLVYGLECFSLFDADVRSVGHTILSGSFWVIQMIYYYFLLPNEMTENRWTKVESKFVNNNDLLYYLGFVILYVPTILMLSQLLNIFFKLLTAYLMLY